MILQIQYMCQNDNYLHLHSLNSAQPFQAHHMVEFHRVNKTDYSLLSYNDFYKLYQYLDLMFHL